MTLPRFPRSDARLLALASLPATLVGSVFGLGARSWTIGAGATLALSFVAYLSIALRRAVIDETASAIASAQASAELAATLGLHAPLPPMTGWAAHPELAALLARRVLLHRPQLVVEAGSGVSTLVHAYALRKNGGGRVVSLDHDRAYAARTREELVALGLDDRAEVIDAPLVPQRVGDGTMLWYALDGLPDAPIDLLLVDGPPVALQPLSRYPAIPLLLDRLADGALVVLDDADRPSERAVVERWLREHPGRLERHHVPTRKGVVVLVHTRATRA